MSRDRSQPRYYRSPRQYHSTRGLEVSSRVGSNIGRKVPNGPSERTEKGSRPRPTVPLPLGDDIKRLPQDLTVDRESAVGGYGAKEGTGAPEEGDEEDLESCGGLFLGVTGEISDLGVEEW
jgi:hypothetical protein